MSRGEVQSVLLDRGSFPTRRMANDYIRHHNFRLVFRGKGAHLTEKYWRYRQRDPGRYARLRTRTVEPGVKHVIGYRA